MKDEQALLQAIAKGERAKAVLACSGWSHDIEPYLAAREVELSKGSSWRPSTSAGLVSVDAIAVGCAYNGGRQDECMNLRNMLLIWVEQGEVAAQKLEKEHKK